MPPKRKRSDPVSACSSCLLLQARQRDGEPEIVCKMDPGYSRCGECVRRGLTACDVDRLKRAIDKAEQEEQMVLDLLQKNMSRLQRVRKQRDLLRRRGSLMLQKKAKTVEDLEELERLEAAAENPDPPEGEQPPKRTRQEGPSAAPSSSSGGGSGDPSLAAGAESPVDYSRVPFWDSSLDALLSSEVAGPLALGDLDFEGGTL
ncbi:hypothetical protein VTN00DRAFT_2760 [Thermoascus crustaceus]|uniref:uncharacterized protein n=1 Tax=Thermoascus crustaceus TaxID=5088 RepID=UPI003743C2AC